MDTVLVKYRNMKFLITRCPHEVGLRGYINTLKKFHVTDLIRVCEADYPTVGPLWFDTGIDVVDWPFTNGNGPPHDIVKKWLHLVKNRFKNNPGSCIAVHCVHGLGRSAALVAVALIEFGLTSDEAVAMIRSLKNGAFNENQVKYLQKYKPKFTSKLKNIQYKAKVALSGMKVI